MGISPRRQANFDGDACLAPKIMALPLSWHDAKPLLEKMDGPAAPENWQGGLPIPVSPRWRTR